MPSLAERMSVQDLKDEIVTQIKAVPSSGVTLEHGGWVSKEEEQERLSRLHHEICYFMREYA